MCPGNRGMRGAYAGRASAPSENATQVETNQQSYWSWFSSLFFPYPSSTSGEGQSEMDNLRARIQELEQMTADDAREDYSSSIDQLLQGQRKATRRLKKADNVDKLLIQQMALVKVRMAKQEMLLRLIVDEQDKLKTELAKITMVESGDYKDEETEDEQQDEDMTAKSPYFKSNK